MQVWFAVLKKEIRLGWPLFLYGFGAFVAVALLATLLTDRASLDVVEGTTGLFYILLLFFFPLYMIGCLAKEDRRFATWMQLPLRGWALITAKLASATVYAAVLAWMTWIMSRLLVARGIDRFKESGITADELQFLKDVQEELLPNFAIFLYLAFSAGVIAMAVAVLIRAIRSKVRFGRSLIGIFIFCSFLFGITKLSETEVYRDLFAWGQWTSLGAVMDHEPIYAGETMIELVMLVLFVWGAGKLLDRKAGV